MKRILVLLLALCTAAAFTACSKTPDIEPTDPVFNPEDYATTVPIETEPPVSGPEVSEPGATVPEGDSETTEPETPEVPTGAAAIVKFYNEAANNTKNQKNFTAVKSDKLDCHMTEGFLSILDGILNDLRKDVPNLKEVFVNGKGTLGASGGGTPQSFLPVEKQPYMSKLQASWVKSASCTQNADGTFTIKLALKDETFAAKTEDPKQHHSCMDTLDVDWNGLPVTINDDAVGYISKATITATVSKDGKLLSELHIYEPVTVRGTVRLLGKFAVEGYWKQDILFIY